MDNHKMKVRVSSILMMLLVALTVATTAIAAPKPPAYVGDSGNVQAPLDSAGVVDDTNTVGTLPFTGMDLAVFAAVGLALVAAGYSMRRASRRQT